MKDFPKERRLRGKFTKDFHYMIWRIFINKINTAFVRFNEGEYGLISDIGFTGAGCLWKTYTDKQKLRLALLNTINENDESYIYGIASKQHPVANKWYKNNIKSSYKTFATIFVNNNWKEFKNILENIDEDVVLVANKCGIRNEYPFSVIEYFPVQFDAVSYYERKHRQIDDMCKRISEYKDTLIFFCAGPLSNYMIWKCWKLNPNNRYIDIGSTLDEYIIGRKTRNYFKEDSKTFNLIDKL